MPEIDFNKQYIGNILKEWKNLQDIISSGKALGRREAQRLTELKELLPQILEENEKQEKCEIIPDNKALAEYLGVSLRQLGYYKNPRRPEIEPLPAPRVEGGYYKDEIDAWNKKRKYKKVGVNRKNVGTVPFNTNVSNGDLSDLQRKERFEADLKEIKSQIEAIKLQEIQGELIKTDEIYPEWVGRIIEVKTGLLAWSKKLPPQLEGLTKREIARILDEEVYFLLNQFARHGKYTPKKKAEKKKVYSRKPRGKGRPKKK